MFLEPDSEVLVAANGDEVAAHLCELTPEKAQRIGRAGYERVLSEHTYEHRIEQLERTLARLGEEVAA